MLFQRRRDSNSVHSGGLELGSLEPTKHVRVVPLGRLLEDGPSHFSSTASKHRKKGITQLRNVSIYK